MLTRDQLPNDIEQLKDLILEQQALYEQRIQTLEHQLQLLLRQQYGQRSEKQKPAMPLGEKSAPKTTPHGRNPLPDNLPRDEVIHTVPAAQLACPQCGQERAVIGEEVSEQLDYVPGQLRVIRHKRQKIACKHCQGEIVIAELPPQPIDKGLPTGGLLAHVIVDKYHDHLPLHRQEQRFAREGIALARTTLCDWVMHCALLFEPLVQAMKMDAFAAPKLNTDDTPVPVQAKDKVKLGRLWVYVSDTEGYPKITLYDYSPSRAGQYPQAFLQSYNGYLQADAFAGYDELYTKGSIIEVGCLAHARRKFEEIVKQSQQPGRAHTAMAFIGQLYQIERDCKDLLYAERYQYRQQHSRPILDKFKAWLDEQTILPKSPLGKAIAYNLNHWQALTNYLLDGCLSIDNNSAERAIRPLAIGRKNWTFAVVLQLSCVEDGGRPTEVGYQELASNDSKLRLLRARVVSVGEKSSETRHVRIRKTNNREPLMKRRKPATDIKTVGSANRQDQSTRSLNSCVGGVRRADGVSLIQAFMWNCRNQSL